MVAPRGCAWLLQGVCMVVPRGACVVALGGMCCCSGRGVCVVARGQGGAWLLWGGMHGCSGGHVWLLQGGHAWLLPGVCMVALGGCAWLLWGVCMVAPGGHTWDTTRYGDTVNEWAVRILLECILVFSMIMFVWRM